LKILGIETSCDETSCAIVDSEYRILANPIYSQLEHSKYGGIVPEVASRQQIKKIIPIYRECLRSASMTLDDVEGISVTSGPGLIGCLLVGVNFAKGLAFATGKPLIGVNHLEGHLLSAMLVEPSLKPPFLGLIVSGGHTILVHVKDLCDYAVLGQTRDDAAGEAYDKVAKLLGLGYPGGAEIDRLAKDGDPKFFRFPRARIKSDPMAFSFSGLKTAVALYVRDKGKEFVDDNLANICASFQASVIDMLTARCVDALKINDLDKLAVSGGVAANSALKGLLTKLGEKYGFSVYFPDTTLCTDNGAMIALAGLVRLKRGFRSDLSLDATAQFPIHSERKWIEQVLDHSEY